MLWSWPTCSLLLGSNLRLLHTWTKSHDHEIGKAFENHPNAIQWEIDIQLCNRLAHKLSIKWKWTMLRNCHIRKVKRKECHRSTMMCDVHSYDYILGCNANHAILLHWGFYSPVLNIGNEAYVYIYTCMQLLLGKRCTEKLKLLWIGYFNLGGISHLCGHGIFAHYKILMFASSGWTVGLYIANVQQYAMD